MVSELNAGRALALTGAALLLTTVCVTIACWHGHWVKHLGAGSPDQAWLLKARFTTALVIGLLGAGSLKTVELGAQLVVDHYNKKLGGNKR